MRAVECTFAFICARRAYNHLLLHFSRSSMFCYFSNHYIYRITNITQNNLTQFITNNPQITERFGVTVTPLMLFSSMLRCVNPPLSRHAAVAMAVFPVSLGVWCFPASSQAPEQSGGKHSVSCVKDYRLRVHMCV